MQRIPELRPDSLTSEQQCVHAAFQQGRPGGVQGGPLMAWLHSPELASRAQALGVHCRYGSSLPARLSELAILVTAAAWNSSYEWNAHAPAARAAGLTEDCISAVREGREPACHDDAELAVYRFATELHSLKRVTAATWTLSEGALSTRQIVDLIGVLGYYTLIAMTTQALEIRGSSSGS